MRGAIDVGQEFEEDELPIVHPERTIGDSVELVPGSTLGEPGPVREILRTRGGDQRAQLLTVTVVGSGVYESSLRGASNDARGPLVGLLEWGIRGAKAKIEFDIPQGGVTLSVVASYVQLAARYDGLLLANGVQLDPAATGGQNPGPKQRVAAMLGYGAYGAAARLTRTFRLDNLSAAVGAEGRISNRLRVPPFGRRVLVSGLGLDGNTYRVRFGALHAEPDGDILFEVGEPPRLIDLPGDATYVEVANAGATVVTNPVLVFELAM